MVLWGQRILTKVLSPLSSPLPSALRSPAAEKVVKLLSEVSELLLSPSEDSAGCFKGDKRGWCVLVRQGRSPGID